MLFRSVVEISLTGQYSPRHTLTQEELAAYNAVMDPAVRDESGDIVDLNIQPASYFLTSYYDNVRDLNFEEFIRYHLATCERMDLMGASGHTVDILSVQK